RRRLWRRRVFEISVGTLGHSRPKECLEVQGISPKNPQPPLLRRFLCHIKKLCHLCSSLTKTRLAYFAPLLRFSSTSKCLPSPPCPTFVCSPSSGSCPSPTR